MHEVINSIFIFAAVQGFLLSFLLFRKQQNKIANKVLASIILLISVDLIVQYLTAIKLYEQFPFVFGVTISFPFIYGPLFYFYTLALTKRVDTFKPKYLFHLIPALLYFLSFSPFYFLLDQEKFYVIKGLSSFNSPAFAILNFLVPYSGLIYTALALRIIRQFNEGLKNNFSNIDKIKITWLQYLTILSIGVWLVSAFNPLLAILLDNIISQEKITYIVVSIFIFAIGYEALRKPEVFGNVIAESEKDFPLRIKGKYERSSLTEEEINRIKNLLIQLMDHKKLYLNPKLTLSHISEELGVSNHNLSEVLTKAFDKNFYDFVNIYRVKEFKERIKNPEFNSYSLLALALDSGFSSKSSFNSNFKKITNMTPSEFRKMNA